MKTTLRFVTAVMAISLGSVSGLAQQTTPSPMPTPSSTSGSTAGNYTVVSSVEVGYRGLSFDGDVNKYQSDLNYKAGPRLFDSSFFARSNDGRGQLFDTLVVTATGWAADPHGQVRVSAEKSDWYRFNGTYRRFKYFRFLNNFANPNWVFSPATFSRAPNPITGEHGQNSRMRMGDFDLTLLPKNRYIRINVGYSPERYGGEAFSNYHAGGNEFQILNHLNSRADDFRIGVDASLGPVDISFLQGLRRFRDDVFSDFAQGINVNPAAAQLTSFNRQEPARGDANFTRLSVHSLVAKRLDLTARLVHSRSTSNFLFLETLTGRNFNPRVTGWPPTPPAATPNTLNLGRYQITGITRRPSTLGDFGATILATNKLRISNTFRVEKFEINGTDVFNDFFSITRGSGATLRTDTFASNNLDATRITDYRKYQNTIEGDYQFGPRYSVHLGYRFGSRRIEECFDGFNLGSSGSLTPPPARTSDFLEEDNQTHAILGGFKARPVKDWTINFDAEHGTADNVFTRIGNYNYTNIRAKSRYTPNRNVSFTLAFITKNNSNPSEIAGVSIEDFGVDVKSRVFTSAVSWTPHTSLALNAGYNYNWVNSDAVIDYFFNSVRHPLGHSLYFMRNNFFFVDAVGQLHSRVTLYAAYRVNKDNGQGDRTADPAGNPGTLIASYPMSFQSPEARLAVKLHRRLDWNLGYQYYNYDESSIVGPRPQNYHAHLPYTSLRVYIGRKE